MLSVVTASQIDKTALLLGGGILGVFLVIGVIMGIVYLLNYITNKPKKTKKDAPEKE